MSGTYKEYLQYSPAYIIKYGTLIWAIENEIDLIHYGGGITNNKDDGLYRFKKKFGRNTEFEFYVGKKIWNKYIYDKLCIMKNADKNSDFFPAYREK